MLYSPHKLSVFTGERWIDDSFGRPIKVKGEWEELGACRCRDNDTKQLISVNGEDYQYSYKIIHTGSRIEAGVKIRVDGRDEKVGGKVIKSSKTNYFNYSIIYI